MKQSNTFTLQLHGSSSKSRFTDKVKPFDEGIIEPVDTILFGNSSRGEDNLHSITCDKGDIINLEFEDGAEWISSAQDLQEIFGNNQISRGATKDGTINIPAGISTNNNTRDFSDIAIKLFKRYVLTTPKKIGGEIGSHFDERLMPKEREGLYRLSPSFELIPLNEGDLKPGHYLLFSHGTASNTEGSFAKLVDDNNSEVWKTICQKYGDNILCLEHKTISVSPFQNVLDIIQNLPAGCTLDVISHSRGGIVADVLARCDHRNDILGFSEDEVNLIENEDGHAAELLRGLSKYAIEKKIEIHKIIRIASPSRGTILLSGRLDHFLNGLLRAIGLAVGDAINPLYQLVRTFIMEVINTKTSAEDLPGLNAMVPNSTFQKILNNPLVKIKSDLVVIEGNAEFGSSIKQSILVVFSNLFYWKSNDFVVNTDSMRYGAIREKGIHIFLSKTSATNHFSYFKNDNTQTAIRNAIEWQGIGSPNQFEHIPIGSENRGVALKLFDYRDEVVREVSQQRPIVIFLPGTMGSNLEVGGDKIWVDFYSISKGKLKTHLAGDARANSIVGKYYSKLIEDLGNNGYDVRIFPYDWRKSLSIAAEELGRLLEKYLTFQQPIKILAHSMGGLVVRDLMRTNRELWNSFINRKNARLVMLGTPWRGSYLTMEVLTGFGDTVKKLAFLDFKHSKDELLRVFNTYEGIYELLPIDETELEQQIYWRNISNQLSPADAFSSPPQGLLDHFAEYKKAVKEFYATQIDFKNIHYIAGHKDFTVSGYQINESFFRNSLRFSGTSAGDGSVTYALGIPVGIPGKQVHYTYTEHMNLANDSSLFLGINELLDSGTTSQFMSDPPSLSNRGGIAAKPLYEEIEHLDTLDAIFGVRGATEKIETQASEIFVSVTHADLKVAKYPVMVGHFRNDGIVSAERALDRQLKHKLEERRMLGKYANEIEEQFVLYDAKIEPKGAVIIGLGDPTKLTSYNLMRTVEKGILEYALYMRDNSPEAKDKELASGITSLSIGSGFGKLALESSLNAIIQGVNNANRQIEGTDSGLSPVRNIEFIELFEHIARNIFYSLQRIKNQETKLSIKIDNQIHPKYGAKKQIQYNNEEEWWWHQFMTKGKEEKGKVNLQFLSSSGLARAEEKDHFISKEIVKVLLEEMAKSYEWKPRLAKTLFEILMPNEFKQFIRNQNNILWKMDKYTAAIPWEMFHDIEYDKNPTFVSAGLIRQLATTDFEQNPEMVRSKTALVIGDPLYSNLPQLPAAKKEAEWVHNYLKQQGYDVGEPMLVRKSAVENIEYLSNEKFKILHIAAHGLFDSEEEIAGIAIGGDILLTSGVIKNILHGKVPEFVFINCCYSGTMDNEYEQETQNRYGFAANVGTELIQMGVNAAVVTGWPVNDDAADLFARVFYERMIAGYYFGEAVKMARKECYSKYPRTNTWGAYQCYGNPWYKFDIRISSWNNEISFITVDEILCELDNILVDTKNIKDKDVEDIIRKTEAIVNRAIERNLYGNAQILEKEAQIYAELNQPNMAIEKYACLLKTNKASFSMKSFEQYCNLWAKNLGNNQRKNLKEISALKKKLSTLIGIGETPERLNIYGSAYKRFAALSYIPAATRIGYLEQMESKYAAAYRIVATESPVTFTYPLTNWLTAFYFLKGKTALPFDDDTTPFEFLKEVEKQLLKIGNNAKDFWEDIAVVNTLMCQLLFAGDNAASELSKEIGERYIKTFEASSSKKSLQSEIEHVDFILNISKPKEVKHKLSKAVRNAFEEIKQMLENLK